ncbi:protein-disulfide reductase DsbD domain-containing protein [Rhodohalobacter sulfatireducens]|uniref:Protein-disulfide reductase DsbD N-terminal domain-containing protein n=1 Tax=Rhodohalobacter sulfatireducens TaxID=2911366 RepID=A0ABS9KBR4_9BACT|nr:protein-disulfide reductase DsbD domain-containing protein [Rhodohalobacter sulfatireducens]MCG2588294.1 protein-disulfide reductase DsbD N-terminal domain-containing protein [Rhodohalobacter sulfatireducens]
MKKQIFFMGIALFALSPFFVQAQLLDPVSYSVSERPDTVQAGEVFEVTVQASIDENWHLYSTLNHPDLGPYPTQFTAGSSNFVIAGTVTESEAEIEYDPNFETELGWHSESAEFNIPIAFQEDLRGNQALTLEVYYQVCDDRSCLPPKTKKMTTSLYLDGVADSPYQDAQTETSTSQQGASRILIIGSIIFLLLSISLLWLMIRAARRDSSKK